jgi:SAM-dependent methyltransferase
MKKLTNEEYWNSTYTQRDAKSNLNLDGFSNSCNRLILEKILAADLPNKRILEIGAGDSMWLPYLAERFSSSQFVGLDYSDRGCALLRERTRDLRNVAVAREDMFTCDSELHETFDVAISFGVVEHFDELDKVLAAKKRFLKRGGLMFTLIPNLSGALGFLASKWNRDVYEKHNPHDWPSFSQGHRLAGLDVVSGGYLCSNHFGVLSACFPDQKGLAWQLSRVMVRISLGTWWIEEKLGQLPTSRAFSPYIYALSRNP